MITHLANSEGIKINPATGIGLPPYDNVVQTIVNETCTFTYRLNSVIVATVTVVYTNSLLQTIVSVTIT